MIRFTPWQIFPGEKSHRYLLNERMIPGTNRNIFAIEKNIMLKNRILSTHGLLTDSVLSLLITGIPA